MSERPKVGVCAFIVRDKKVLFGLRTGAHGANNWSPPGGHFEMNEEPEECAAREAMEEAGVELLNVTRLPVYTNDIFIDEGKHYITLYTVAECLGDPVICESDRCLEWRWFDWDDLPENIFLPVQHFIDAGYSPFITNTVEEGVLV